jgi:hypothetical protein
MKSQPQKPKPQKSKEAKPVLSLPEKLQQAQAEVQRWNGLAANPDLSLPAALFARNMARSSQAAATLYQKAADYQNSPEKQEQEALQARVARSLGTIPSLPGQQPSSDQDNPPSSTKPETSA